MKRLLPFLLVAAAGCASDPQGMPAADHKELGDLYRDNGRWEQAHAEYKAAIAKDPDLYDAYIAMGYVCMYHGIQIYTQYPNKFGDNQRLKDFSEAKLLADECLKRDDGNVDALQLIGVLFWQNGQYDKAMEWFEKVLDSDPKHLMANWYRSWCYFYFKKFNEAADTMEHYLDNYMAKMAEQPPKEHDLRVWVEILREKAKHPEAETDRMRMLYSKIQPADELPEAGKAARPRPEIPGEEPPDLGDRENQ